MQLTTTTVELDVKAGDDDDFGGRDDVREVRVDLGLQVFDFDGRDVRPGLVQVGEHVTQHHVDDALLGGGELAALDLRVPAGAAEEVVDYREHQLRIEHDQRGAPEGVDLHEVQVRG